MPPAPFQIIPCPRDWRLAALRHLHEAMPADQQAVLAQTLDAIGLGDDAAWDGLLVAVSAEDVASEAIEGAVWVQKSTGNTAVVWAPPRETAVDRALLRAAATFVDEHQIALAQMVVSAHDGYSDALLSGNGFPRFAELAYLFAETDSVLGSVVEGEQQCEGLHFVPRAGDEPQRLAAVLEQTYIGTLDCPALDGVRPMDDVLEGYRHQGQHLPQHWYFVRYDDEDVGALILAAHPTVGNWELVYMGLVPSARGRGCGLRVIRFAMDAAARGGAERLVLAVDAANAPALHVYQRAGLLAWDHRIVYARLRSQS